MSVSVLDVSTETRVNDLSLDSATGGVSLVGLVTLEGGDYLAFTQGPNFSSFQTVYISRFSSDGAAEGPSIALAGKYQVQGAGTADGGYVLTWKTDTAYTADFMTQTFDANGVATGSAVSVGTPGAFTQGAASVAVLADGGFAVTWQTRVGSDEQVALQRFDAAGGKVGEELRITGEPWGSAYSPTIDSLSGGGYVVSWLSDDGLNNLVFRAYNASGTVLSSGAQRGVDQEIAALPDGGFILAWAGFAVSPLDDYGVHTQTYNAAGAPVGDLVRVASLPSDSARNVSVAVSADGSY